MTFRPLAAVAWALVLLAAPAHGQPEPPAAVGLPPFLAKMKRHDVTVAVLSRGARGTLEAAAPDLPVTILITAGGAKVRSYESKTEAGGLAKFTGIPTNPEVQSSIGYTITVDAAGVRYPFSVKTIPTDGGRLEVTISPAGGNIASLSLEHAHIELFPDEDNLVVRQSIRISNLGDEAVNLALLPGGGLRLPVPDGAKHPELHEDVPTEVIEVRGTDLYFKGVVLAGSAPFEVTFMYTIAYDEPTFEFSQTMPVRTTGALIVTPTGRTEGQRAELPLKLVKRGDAGDAELRTLKEGRRFWVLRMPNLELAAQSPLRFAIEGLPTAGSGRLIAMGVALVLVFLLVLFGFRGANGTAGDQVRISRAHLENERDRLHRALERMRRAVEKGRLSAARFEREQEAITARLVSLYRALDRLDGRAEPAMSERPKGA